MSIGFNALETMEATLEYFQAWRNIRSDRPD